MVAGGKYTLRRGVVAPTEDGEETTLTSPS